jgi:hypothetical protein
MHKVDHPQYHLPQFKKLARPRREPLNDGQPKQEWRGGAKVQKK